MTPYRWFFSLLIGFVILLVFQLVRLQIVEHAHYDQLARRNIAETLRIDAPRGEIWSEEGVPLARNHPRYQVFIFPPLIESERTVIRAVSTSLAISEAVVSSELATHAKTAQPFVIKTDVPLSQIAVLREWGLLPGVRIQVQPVREYPQGGLLAHVLGYVGEVSKEELENPLLDYQLGEMSGKLGIEKQYEASLRGERGMERIQTVGELIPGGVSSRRQPIPGKDLYLTIRFALQRKVESTLARYGGYGIGAIALDPNTGGVLALASTPHFNPNWFLAPLPRARWHQIQAMNAPFLNRALSPYPPGSTFKVVVAGGALEEGLVDLNEMFTCPGYFQLGNRKAFCWKHSGHGRLNLREAIIQSCDVVFYQLGLRLGVEKLNAYARGSGFGEVTHLDLPGEASGFLPTTSWKEHRLKEPWYEGDTINFAIGQGFVQVTPLQLARLYAAIANGGRLFPPHLATFRGVTAKGRVTRLPFRSEVITFLQEALEAVVSEGTGRAAQVSGWRVAGKTGTAEDPPRKPHAWFVCYAPTDHPEMALAVFVEQGEHGDQVAAHVAGNILRAWRSRF